MSKQHLITKEKIYAAQPAITSELQKRYGESPAKMAAAEKARFYANEYLFNRPIGMNSNFRMADLQVQMRDYVHKRFEEDESKGFLFGGELLIGWVLAGLVSWVVRKILDKLFD